MMKNNSKREDQGVVTALGSINTTCPWSEEKQFDISTSLETVDSLFSSFK